MLVQRKDLKIILMVAVLAVVLLVLSQALPKAGKPSNAGMLPVPTEGTTIPPAPEETSHTASPAAQAEPSPVPTEGTTVPPAPDETSHASASPAVQAEPSAVPTEGTTVPPAPEETSLASASPTPQAEPSAVPTLAPAEAYLKVQVENRVYAPLPLDGERDIEIAQWNGKRNVVRITRDSIAMHSSNCDNQDCVHQGIVSLENRDMRVLQSFIICLPNQVVLELMNAQEAQADWAAVYAPSPSAPAPGQPEPGL